MTIVRNHPFQKTSRYFQTDSQEPREKPAAQLITPKQRRVASKSIHIPRIQTGAFLPAGSMMNDKNLGFMRLTSASKYFP
jgi:hypothetical protein